MNVPIFTSIITFLWTLYIGRQSCTEKRAVMQCALSNSYSSTSFMPGRRNVLSQTKIIADGFLLMLSIHMGCFSNGTIVSERRQITYTGINECWPQQLRRSGKRVTALTQNYPIAPFHLLSPGCTAFWCRRRVLIRSFAMTSTQTYHLFYDFYNLYHFTSPRLCDLRHCGALD
jgi:hypothetical protein